MYVHKHAKIDGHTHTHPFNGPFSSTTQLSRYQKGKPIWILLKQETVSGSGISWAICKSAPHSRQITMPSPHHSDFTGWMPLLTPNQQHQSTEGQVKTKRLWWPYDGQQRHNDGLHGSASPVLTATGFVNGRWQFSTPHRIHTL